MWDLQWKEVVYYNKNSLNDYVYIEVTSIGNKGVGVVDYLILFNMFVFEDILG
jgi:hypothetical protein